MTTITTTITITLMIIESTANIYTYTPIVYNTIYISLTRRCKHFLGVVYKLLSRIEAAAGGGPNGRGAYGPPRGAYRHVSDCELCINNIYIYMCIYIYMYIYICIYIYIYRERDRERERERVRERYI